MIRERLNTIEGRFALDYFIKSCIDDSLIFTHPKTEIANYLNSKECKLLLAKHAVSSMKEIAIKDADEKLEPFAAKYLRSLNGSKKELFNDPLEKDDSGNT